MAICACGRDVPDGARFCDACGSPMAGPESPSASLAETQVRKVGRGRALLIVSLVVAVALVALVAFLLINRQSAAALPKVLVCSGSPSYKPSGMGWCASLCSTYVEDLDWNSWTAESASATGTLVTNNGVPNCADGTRSYESNFSVILDNPKEVKYCGPSGLSSGLLFTSTNLWGESRPGSLPASRPIDCG